MRIRLSIIAATLLAAVSAACSEPSSSSFVPSLSFDYTGVASGRYEVRAGPPADGNDLRQPYVEGLRPGIYPSMFEIVSGSPTAGTDLASWASISAPDLPGDFDLSSCASYSQCQFIQGGLNYPNTAAGSLKEGALGWRLDQGVVRVSRPSGGNRTRVTFSGSAQVWRYTGAHWDEYGRITITNGQGEVTLP